MTVEFFDDVVEMVVVVMALDWVQVEWVEVRMSVVVM